MADVVVIGAGPNGLVAANLLADAGLEVLVLEEQDTPGGAVRSGPLTVPGFEHDLFSAFYPFAAASPVIQQLDLHHHGLRWRRSPLVLAHPTPDGPTVVLSQDPEETAASLERFATGDGETWRRVTAFWSRVERPFMNAFTTPFPPVRGAAELAGRLRVNGLLQFARLAMVSLRRFSDENFRGPGAALLIGANALHADLTPEMPGSALFGLILCGIGQRHGYPVPEGGAQRLTDALVDRLRSRGGSIETGERVQRVLVKSNRAAGVLTAAGRAIAATAGSWPTRARRSCTATCWHPRISRRGSCAVSGISSTTTPRSSWTGPYRARSPGTHRRPVGPERSTWPTAWISSARAPEPCSARSSRSARS